MCWEPLAPVWTEVLVGCPEFGNCVSSPYFPRNYGPDEHCVLRLNRNGTLVIDPFETEAGLGLAEDR